MVEQAIPITIGGVEWSAGAPEPIVLSSESRTFVIFYGPDGPDLVETVVTAEIVRCVSIKSGFPNDEVLHGHRLWGRGLAFYRVHEVQDSAWIAELAAIESVHDRAAAEPFAASRHFVLTFHDSTVEAVAADIVALAVHSSQAEALRAVTVQLST